jgi:hypothetical protein
MYWMFVCDSPDDGPWVRNMLWGKEVNVSINIIVAIAGVCLIDLCYIFVNVSYFNEWTTKVEMREKTVSISARDWLFFFHDFLRSYQGKSRISSSIYIYISTTLNPLISLFLMLFSGSNHNRKHLRNMTPLISWVYIFHVHISAAVEH